MLRPGTWDGHDTRFETLQPTSSLASTAINPSADGYIGMHIRLPCRSPLHGGAEPIPAMACLYRHTLLLIAGEGYDACDISPEERGPILQLKRDQQT
ncbi:predicted protein [Plenodomus lingam JN3]|uniref:Uncharacterized protein n=1 Tax=Leptosphaeria maculans (strain JN3 / isolate v23.1.3 / race Av1-4-5-6-7-8) TaxID=985895 RepID=E4ZFX4_LEPMJ|nr:predicted protein [Plenodomus lingam JN3]CBX90194.1 predicted protein [Plenodomus lingam JN3]